MNSEEVKHNIKRNVGVFRVVSSLACLRLFPTTACIVSHVKWCLQVAFGSHTMNTVILTC